MANVALVPAASMAWLNNVVAVIDEFKKVGTNLTMNQVSVFLTIATNPDINQGEVMEKTGLSDASTSRIVSILSDYGNRGTPALKLVEMHEDPADRRNKKLKLSKKGQALASRLATAVAKGCK